MDNQEKKQLAESAFNRLHDEGAEHFGMLWLYANRLMSELAQREYVPEDRLGDIPVHVKALMSEAAWILCSEVEKMRKDAMGKNNTLPSATMPDAT